jgi:GDP/UDP-N,N'-diacetylbacillosamine 2-epimerase (hydrolysing)
MRVKFYCVPIILTVTLGIQKSKALTNGVKMGKQRKICVVTGTRAEYGLLRRLIIHLNDSKEFQLQLVVTGTHLSKKFGETYKEIEADGLEISRKVDLELVSDTPVALTKSTSLGLLGFADSLDSLKPDLLLVLGDRFEILSAVVAAMFARIPIAHLHGGELTEGLIDDAIRHSVTKFSHLHFVANEEYKSRVIQLGENPKFIFSVGGLGADAIQNIKLLGRDQLEKSLGFKFSKKNILITFHPVTLEHHSSSPQISELLAALSNLEETTLIFTMPNADTDGRVIFDHIENFVNKNKNAYSFKSLGQLRYLSCIDRVDLVIGNSSSGLTEVPSFKKPTINIGDRQKGRMKAQSVIDCEPIESEIKETIIKAYSDEFQSLLKNVKNPYGDGGASERIIEILKITDFSNLINKQFYDVI